jgi:23S rRNA pseudouridine1911/1915/1917 synthase
MTDEHIVLHVDAEHTGNRLDAFIAGRCTAISRSKIQKLIENGFVLLNGSTADKKKHCAAGDVVDFSPNGMITHDGERPLPQNIPLDCIYEDESLLAVNKPAGLVVHPGNGNPDSTLVNALVYHIASLSQGSVSNRPGIVHRLDKDTSGILLIAKNDTVHAQLSTMFANREIEKYYIGICSGMRPHEHDSINLPLARSRREPVKRSVQNDGKQACTEYWQMGYERSISVLRLKLHTGRTHQIRVHCSYKGFPIIGDDLYGGGTEHLQKLPVLDRPFAYSIYKCFSRHALHAHTVRFIHPVTGQSMELHAPLPQDFNNALSIMGLAVTASDF